MVVVETAWRRQEILLLYQHMAWPAWVEKIIEFFKSCRILQLVA